MEIKITFTCSDAVKLRCLINIYRLLESDENPVLDSSGYGDYDGIMGDLYFLRDKLIDNVLIAGWIRELSPSDYSYLKSFIEYEKIIKSTRTEFLKDVFTEEDKRRAQTTRL